MDISDAIAALRELNEPVPKPFRLPTEAEVNQAERELRVRFHPDYRRFLREGGDVVYGTLEPARVGPDVGHLDLVEVCQDAWNLMDVPHDLLPICEDNGDYYCMNREGQVVFWSHNGADEERWPDLATWIEQVWIGGN